jgi:TonB family protein
VIKAVGSPSSQRIIGLRSFVRDFKSARVRIKTIVLSICAIGSFVQLCDAQQRLAWQPPTAGASWPTDSTQCAQRARTIAGVDTGAAVQSELGHCLQRVGWVPVRRFSVPTDCKVFDLQWLDAPSGAAWLSRVTSQFEGRLREFQPRLSDRSERRRLAFTLYRGEVLLRFRSVGRDESDELAGRIHRQLTERARGEQFVVERQRITIDVEGLLIFRGECLADVRLSEDDPDYDALLTGQPAKEPAYFEFQVERQAVRLRTSPVPRYPDVLRSARMEGEVLAQFVVDTLGRFETGSLKILKSSHELFSQAVREAAPRMVYSPAELSGRKVRQLIQEPFTFTLPR